MKMRIDLKPNHPDVNLASPDPYPEFFLNREELETGSSQTLVRVVVEGKDGKRGIAFLSARIKSGGVLAFELVTKAGKDFRKDVRREAVASWGSMEE